MRGRDDSHTQRVKAANAGNQRSAGYHPTGAEGVDVSANPDAHAAEMNRASENAPVTATLDHPVSAVMEDCSAAKV